MVGTQLSFDDLPQVEQPVDDLRLAAGYRLLEQLELRGWDVAVTAAFAGEGLLVIARGDDGIEVKRAGPSVSDVAVDVFKEAMRLPQPRPQLRSAIAGV